MKHIASVQGLKNIGICIFCLSSIFINNTHAQEYSAARVWNEMVLNAVRNDFARPTVHARNLHHTAIAMYDAFAVYDEINETYFLGKTVQGYNCPFTGVPKPSDIHAARRMAISYAVYRLIEYRFRNSPSKAETIFDTDLVFSAFGYDKDFVDTDYSSGNPAALGNYIAEQLIAYGGQDGSNEANDYANTFYEPVNPEINPFRRYFDPSIGIGNERLNDPNRWQQITIPGLVDQAGNIIPGGTLPFLGAEWGRVSPFALTASDKKTLVRDSNEYEVYHDPGPPHYLDSLAATPNTQNYQWGFSLVSHWRSHTLLDSVFLDISPASLGNIEKLPETNSEYKIFYDFREGGDASRGHAVNPHTGMPYEEQRVQRGDYTRVIAEFWADGPESETPPGHWFTILNYVNDSKDLVKKYKGTGAEMSDLEWDVKAYFVLGGAMHDSAIAAWSIKGYYDYIRPISAIRYMIDKGQSSNPTGPNYHVAGLPLVSGSIEQILDGDPLLAFDNSNYGHIKVLANVFEDQKFYFNGDFWSPYQPTNFITPPFAGYVSGHSTFSRAAAEVLTRFTGDAFFPGGLGEYEIPADSYLETNPGPSDSLTLQWATYIDAASQSALSRIWGGIHPPIDDIPGRKIGIKVGNAAFDLADSLFGNPPVATTSPIEETNQVALFPNPVRQNGKVNINTTSHASLKSVSVLNNSGQIIHEISISSLTHNLVLDMNDYNLDPGIYHFQILLTNKERITKKVVILN